MMCGHTHMLVVFFMYLWVTLHVSVCLVYGGGGSNQSPCLAGQFSDKPTNSCLPCSTCKNNEVTRRLCSPTSDTVCSPFREFKFFHQQTDDGSKDGKSLQHVAEKTEVHLTIYSEGSGHSVRNVAVESKESQHWRTVAFALIGALSALIFLGTLVVLVTCRRINQSRPPATPGVEDDDADCPYVVIHTIRPSASEEEVTYQVPPGPNALHQLARQRQRLCKYHPKRRLLQANEYADDVFESEDSGSRLRMSLQAIPENEHSENETDCSAESSTPTTVPEHPTHANAGIVTTPSCKDAATDLTDIPLLGGTQGSVSSQSAQLGEAEGTEDAGETSELLTPDLSTPVS